MKSFKQVLRGLSLMLYSSPLYGLEDVSRVKDDDFTMAFIKVAFFLFLAYSLSLFIKKKQGNFPSKLVSQSEIELLTHKVIRDSSTVSLIKVNNRKILITTNKFGGVAMLNIEDEEELVDAQQPLLREVSNA